ncbi:cytochrome P450 [Stachybotrys elegans]|uniref:Cytochrome P450 n=1 Tax=Stachybotrys elegans TaxID=80388 RepID=A0A8K0WTM5_9HYPO|nr:cytochrome P450 [Stachybotrys elegans]
MTDFLVLLAALLIPAIVVYLAGRPRNQRGVAPLNLRDPVPTVFNTLQFILNNAKFMSRVRAALQRAPVVKFHLGWNRVYVVTGLKNYQAIFSSRELTYNGIMLQIGFPKLYRMSDDEIQRFANDKTGLKGSADLMPGNERYWASKYHVLYDYLSRHSQLQPVVEEFARQFSLVMESFPEGQWTTLSVNELTKRDFTKCAITTLFGPRLFALNKDFLDIFWTYDDHASKLVWGFPEWVYPAPYKASDRYLAAFEKYIADGMENFDWQASGAEANWEPHFGARITRELVKWLSDAKFRPKTVAGALGTLLQNSNTIPVVAWIIMEINNDPQLLKALREEVATAFTTDATTGKRSLDNQKVLSLPLLQSAFTEVLRLRMSMVIMRVVEKPVTLSGVYIDEGSTIHAYTHLSQTDEAIWGSPSHPADEFWAERHIKYVEEEGQVRREFVMAANPGHFFPFGGGVPICPGRHFARNEIFTMMAILVDRFDMEFVRWTLLDGSGSDRPAQSDMAYSGIGVLQPDRDMVVRWRRRW